MSPLTRHPVRAIAAAVAACCAVPVLAADVQRPSEACTKSINAIGASLGHTEKTTPDGRLAYQYVVRSNGTDYTVSCDAATGVVGEVAPRTPPAGGAL